MATLLLSAIDLRCDYQNLQFSGPTIEDCFEALTELRCAGWEIIAAHLVVEDQQVTLPVEAFDGAPIKHPVQQLSLEWERLLNA